MKLMDIDSDTLGIPDTDYDARVTMPSAEFARIVRDLSQLGESVRIEVTKEGVRFVSEGEAANGNILLRHTDTTGSKKGESSKVKKEDDDEEEDDEEEDDEDGSPKKKVKKEKVKKENGEDVEMDEEGDGEFKADSDGEEEPEEDEGDSGSKKRKKAPSKVSGPSPIPDVHTDVSLVGETSEKGEEVEVKRRR